MSALVRLVPMVEATTEVRVIAKKTVTARGKLKRFIVVRRCWQFSWLEAMGGAFVFATVPVQSFPIARLNTY
jgi:hypothetical protein